MVIVYILSNYHLRELNQSTTNSLSDDKLDKVKQEMGFPKGSILIFLYKIKELASCDK
jgi:hypothetical protein